MASHCRNVDGRSPRVRGRLDERTSEVWNSRKIPARAGTTSSHQRPPCNPSEDPRACGDDRSTRLSSSWDSGRSPRVRGRLGNPRSFRLVAGKIPARAGTTCSVTASDTRLAEDPRACGDDTARMARMRDSEGRSPRVRGRPRSTCTGRSSWRKIPARAGTTGERERGDCQGTEDPRACGDDTTRSPRPPAAEGRSPRVRGRRDDRRNAGPGRGKIPACAGTTTMFGVAACSKKEDPRACGDDPNVGCANGWLPGRSPRVRGRPQPVPGTLRTKGKIPARAGTTAARGSARPRLQEDPRACGDDPSSAAMSANRWGRSPRVRGRRGAQRNRIGVGGKIPARAGTTIAGAVVSAPVWEDPRACGDDITLTA